MTNGTCVSMMHGENDRSIEASQKRFMFDGLHRAHMSVIVLSGRWVCMVACVIVLRGQPAAGQPVTKQVDFVPASVNDSLALQLLDIAIAKAEVEACAADFWHRLIPSVSVSATIGVRQLAFIDPATSTPYIFPKDSYRLTVSLSLTEIISSTQHEQALLTLDRLHTERAAMEQNQRKDNERRVGEQNALLQEIQFLREEMSLLKQHLAYVELLFEQGKTDFAALIRAKLQLLGAEKSIAKLQLHLTNEKIDASR